MKAVLAIIILSWLFFFYVLGDYHASRIAATIAARKNPNTEGA